LAEPRSGCPINLTLETLGDRWSLLIIQGLARHGPQGFNALADGLPGISRSVLVRRLRHLESLGLLDKLHSEVFREIHANGRPLTVIRAQRVDPAATEKRAREFLASHGVSADDFAKHYRSFSTENRLRQTENLSRRYMLDHTPMVVVQGKYLTDASMAGGQDELFELVNDLAAREHEAG